ncbi:hypothetical protein GCM10009527_005170 [Actinomadura nitritigenes]
MRMRTALPTTAAAVAAVGSLLALPSVAEAASNPYTPVGVCGSGYHVIDSRTLRHQNGSAGGTVYLLYNNSNGYNCAVTIKGVSVGTATKTGIDLLVMTGDKFTRHRNEGNFKYYAGPVRARAAGHCVQEIGYTFSTSSSTSYAATIPEGHCGS